MELVNQAVEQQRAQFRGAEIGLCDTEPDVTRIQVDSAGNLWVMTTRGARPEEEGVIQWFDVFTPDGHFTRRVALAGEGNGRKDSFFLSDDRVIRVVGVLDAAVSQAGLTGDEDAEAMSVVCYSF
jgi:hypothetical protein